ncbi:MAG: hypothetical protein FWE71_04860 [Nocardioidaceae bacterium]|nr:hypothetical protein [Nocardioidaceae bacterium]MCL2614394.1 hypothetical protein [Nocardioidaceae bacterium]
MQIRMTPKRSIALAVVVVLMAGLVAGSLILDKSSDRRRAMYRNIIQVQQLEYDLIKAGKKPVLGKLRGRKNAPDTKLGPADYKPARGVILTIAERDGATCIKGVNRFKDRTAWQCLNMDFGRPTLGGLR